MFQRLVNVFHANKQNEIEIKPEIKTLFNADIGDYIKIHDIFQHIYSDDLNFKLDETFFAEITGRSQEIEQGGSGSLKLYTSENIVIQVDYKGNFKTECIQGIFLWVNQESMMTKIKTQFTNEQLKDEQPIVKQFIEKENEKEVFWIGVIFQAITFHLNEKEYQREIEDVLGGEQKITCKNGNNDVFTEYRDNNFAVFKRLIDKDYNEFLLINAHQVIKENELIVESPNETLINVYAGIAISPDSIQISDASFYSNKKR